MKWILPLVFFFTFSLDAVPKSMKLDHMLSHLSDSDDNQDKDLTLSENLHNGKILKLSNGTVWEVAPQDTNITEIWIFPFPLEVQKSTNKTYPYYIVNKRSKTKVLVRPLPSSSGSADQEPLMSPHQSQPITPNQQPQAPAPSTPQTYPAPNPVPLN